MGPCTVLSLPNRNNSFLDDVLRAQIHLFARKDEYKVALYRRAMEEKFTYRDVQDLCRGCQWKGAGITFRTVRSPRGLALDALKSGMQKYIRRAETAKAVFCAREIHIIATSSLEEGEAVRTSGAKRIYTNLVHRLMIILMEDCGPSAALILPQFAAEQVHAGDGRAPVTALSFARERGAISRMAAMLANSPHSRIFSHLKAIIYSPVFPKRANVRALCLAMHESIPSYGASIQRIANAIQDAKNARDVMIDLRAFTAEINPVTFTTNSANILRAWSLQLSNCRELDLVPGMMIACDIYARLAPVAISRANFGAIPVLTALDDYALDRHTTEGRGRISRAEWATQFAREGAQVFNADPFWHCAELEEFYVRSKSALAPIQRPINAFNSREIAREDELLEPIVRAQLVTGASKTDTYFARLRAPEDTARATRLRRILSPGPIFVKGPLPPDIIQDAIDISRIKRSVFSELVSTRVLYFMCQPTALVSPIGLRARSSAQCTGMLLSANVARGLDGDIPRRVTNSKVWPDTCVVNWDGIALSQESLASLTAAESRDVQLIYLFRFILAIGDGALRNLVFARDGRVAGTDEDMIKEPACATWCEFLATLQSSRLVALLRDAPAQQRATIDQWIARFALLRETAPSHVSRVNLAQCYERIESLSREKKTLVN